MLSRLDTALTDACEWLLSHWPATTSFIIAVTPMAFYLEGNMP